MGIAKRAGLEGRVALVTGGVVGSARLQHVGSRRKEQTWR